MAKIVNHIDKNHDLKIVISVEQGAIKHPVLTNSSRVIILQKPIADYHSLISFAQCVIASGDTVAREGALLNVPTIYIGKRKMRIHEELERAGLLYQPLESNVIDTLDKILKCDGDLAPTGTFGEDTTQVIIRHLSK